MVDLLVGGISQGVFTAVDDDLSGEVLSDPLGISSLWSQLGAELVPFLTQRVYHIRQFVIALLTYRVKNGDIITFKDNEDFTDAFVLGFEQVIAYWQAQNNPDDFSGLVGKIKAKGNNSKSIKIGSNNLIITTQKSAGACAVMKTTLTALELFDPYKGIENIEFSDNFFSSIDPHWKDQLKNIIDQTELRKLFKVAADINTDDVVFSLETDKRNKRGKALNWLKSFINADFKSAQKKIETLFIKKDKNAGVAAILSHFDAFSQKKVNTGNNVEDVVISLKDSKKDKERSVAELAGLLWLCEQLYIRVETFFELISHCKNPKILEKIISDDDIAKIKESANQVHLKTKESHEIIHKFAERFVSVEKLKDLVERVLKVHQEEFGASRRQATPWVHNKKNGTFQTDLPCWKEEDLKKYWTDNKNRWRHSYYVTSLLQLLGRI